MRILRWISGYFVLAIFLLAALSSATAQELKTPDFSAYPQVEHLADELGQMWVDEQALFARLEAMRRAFPEAYQQRRGRYVNLARALESLGDDGLLPMLWVLASDDPGTTDFELGMWRNWRIGLIEAVGRLRDPRSAPVLMQIVVGPDPHGLTRQTATAALGRLGEEAIIEELIETAESTPSAREAIIAGLGSARRIAAANYLLALAAEGRNERETRRAVRSLGDWGNQWAWQTSALEDYVGEGTKGRAVIIHELVGLYPDAPDSVRREIGKTLQLAGAAQSAALARVRAENADRPAEAALWNQLANQMDASQLN